ncbi:MAG TPA: hypothetical protein VF796_08930 [Humisphaera sp.]
MSDKGPFIEVEVADLARDLPAMVRELRQNGRRVRLVDHGVPVAELAPVAAGTIGAAGLPTHPELQGIKFNVNPTSPVPEDEWPDCMR